VKLPSGLAKGLSEDQLKQLESELKHSLLAKQLRKYLAEKMTNAEIKEEQVCSEGIAALASQVGERRGYRLVLNQLPQA
jgi:hypothetical protein